MQRCAARIQRSLKYVELTASLIMKLCLLPLEEEIKTDAFGWCVQHFSSLTHSLPPFPLSLLFLLLLLFLLQLPLLLFVPLNPSSHPLHLSPAYFFHLLSRYHTNTVGRTHLRREWRAKKKRKSVRYTRNEMHELSFNKGER